MNNIREFLIWTVVVPLVLLGLASCQEVRALKSLEGESRYRARLAEDVPTLESIQARNPQTIIHFSEDGVELPVAEALERARRAEQHMEFVSVLRFGSLIVPVVGGLASVLVILAGLVGLVGIRAVRRAGVRSRSELILSFSVWQGRFTDILCVLAAGLCGAAVCVLGFEVWHHVIKNMHAQLDIQNLILNSVLIFSLTCAGAYVAYKIHSEWQKIFVPGIWSMPGFRATPEAYPAVWHFVHEIAERTGARPPDNVILGLGDGFFVTTNMVELHSEDALIDGTALYLSVPYMAYLTREELTSVVAHELGHFLGEDLEYSQRFLPLCSRARRQLNVLTSGEDDLMLLSRVALEPARMLAECFLQSLELSVKFWSRHRELSADAVSSSVVGSRVAAETLLRMVALETALSEGLTLWRESPDEEDAPSELTQLMNGQNGILTFVRDALEKEGVSDPRSELENAIPHPLDTHPLTGQRLEAWGVTPDEELVQQAMRTEESGLLREWGLLVT